MKKLIFINGTMGVGKTTTSKALLALLDGAVFLDGDWCWMMHPFTVTEETKAMVIHNIAFVLNNFLCCSAYEYVIFCWVMDSEKIIQDVRKQLSTNYDFFLFTLTCSDAALKERLQEDIKAGSREKAIIESSLSRTSLYQAMPSQKIDVSHCTAIEAAQAIKEIVIASS